MKQMSLKFKMHMSGVSLVNNNIEKLILNIILGSFGVLAILYLVFLGNMVKDIVERRSLEADARTLSNEVANLGLTYMSMSSGVDLNLSYSLGFKETKTTFATRKSLGFQSSVRMDQNDL